jgi:hypothetical protein
VVKVALFHTGGHTETGALQPFLEKISDNLEFERYFPHCKKRGPKFGRLYPTPDPAHSGCTGQTLIRAMFDILSDKTFSIEADAILLVDDADCRFTSKAEWEWFCNDLRLSIATTYGREIPFIALFAAPEIEAWFVADWNNSFQRRYGKNVASALLRQLKGLNVPDKFKIEFYGHPELPGGGCTDKLSEKICNAMFELPHSVSYNKRFDGVEMLRKLNPATVAESCTTYFKPAYNALRDVANN